MDQEHRSPKVLVAPLDWGLGHATRCIVVVRELLRQNCTVVLAASGKGKHLLQQEFPQLQLLELPGYDIEYAASAWKLAVKIVAQIPKLLLAIKEEQAWLKKVVVEEGLDAVISDNRYGLYHPGVHTVFMTHQLCIKLPVKLAEEFLQDINYDYINRFDECWVPDAESRDNLAGDLSHPEQKPETPVHYTGPLSRFTPRPVTTTGYLLILLSGPEPQRTLLEQRLLTDLEAYTNAVVLVRGLPGSAEALSVADNVTTYNHLPADDLERIMSGAALVIARCGYSTVMDLAALKKKSVLVPTPGQTEQEYLAVHLMKRNFALCITQPKFRLPQALALASAFPFNHQFQFENRLPGLVASLATAALEKCFRVKKDS